ncbi:MAG: hypothetical protein WBC63_04865 [Candidatus Bipolaricaulia bacterium]
MRPPLPIWSIPFLLAIVGLILFLGNLSALLGAIVSLETVVFAAYLLWRSRRATESVGPVSNLLALFPGHLLLLLAVSLLERPNGLAALWAIVPAVSVAYDAVSLNGPRGRVRASILIGLYAILWAVLFTLLERVIAIKRGFGRGDEIIVAAAFGVFGILFISLGILRHWRAAKE